MVNGFRADASVRLEVLEWPALLGRIAEWNRLSAAALEPNAFLDPGFALPAAQQLASSQELIFLVVSCTPDKEPGQRKMLGLWPAFVPQAGLARTWRHEFSAYGAPLVDAERATETLEILLEGFASHAFAPAGVEIPHISANGPFATAIRACAERMGFDVFERNGFERPVLRANPATGALGSAELKLNKYGRKLAADGRFEHLRLRAPNEIKKSVEEFLALESRGWKGRRGTALLEDPRNATFTRSMTRSMARDGKIRVDVLLLDGAPIAMTITLLVGRIGYLWKTAYDENYARLSPGAQLFSMMSGPWDREDKLVTVDSCVGGDNPTAYRLWSERLKIVDFYVKLATRPDSAFDAQLRRDDLRRKFISRAKTVYRTARMKPAGGKATTTTAADV